MTVAVAVYVVCCRISFVSVFQWKAMMTFMGWEKGHKNICTRTRCSQHILKYPQNLYFPKLPPLETLAIVVRFAPEK